MSIFSKFRNHEDKPAKPTIPTSNPFDGLPDVDEVNVDGDDVSVPDFLVGMKVDSEDTEEVFVPDDDDSPVIIEGEVDDEFDIPALEDEDHYVPRRSL